MRKKHLPFTNQYLAGNFPKLSDSKTSQVMNSPFQKKKQINSCTLHCLLGKTFYLQMIFWKLWGGLMKTKTEAKLQLLLKVKKRLKSYLMGFQQTDKLKCLLLR